MFGITRKRFGAMGSAVTMGSVLALMFVATAWASSPIVHRVSAGGPDACISLGYAHPGCNGNFSLEGKVYADGSMSGQYTDRFSDGNGFHAVINCVSVAGNEAWVSGVITSGRYGSFDLTGLPVVVRIRDNGTSAKDPADQIGISRMGDSAPCTAHGQYDLLDMPWGQVTVK